MGKANLGVQAHGKIRKALGEKCACYVLITCSEPTTDGKMEVEMTYEGDACLAAYLIESAHGIMDEIEVVESYS